MLGALQPEAALPSKAQPGFDPDAFLAETEHQAFDPDAFLAQTSGASHAGPLEVGAGETFINKAASALPLGRQVVNGGAALLRRALGFGDPRVRLSPEQQAELAKQGFEAAQPQSLKQQYQAARGDFDARTVAGSEQHKLAAGLGTGVGTALSLLAPLPKVAVGSGAGGRVLSNALTGGAYGLVNGAANSQGDLTKGEVGQVLGDAVGVNGLRQAAKDAGEGSYGRAALDVAGAGGLGGAIAGGVVGGLGEGIRSGAGAVKSFANSRALKALGAAKPDLNHLSTDAASDLGDYALREGVVSPLASRATMAERVEGLRKGAGGKLSDALAQTDTAGESIDKVAAALKLEAEADKLARQPALKGIADKFRAQAEAIRSSPGPQRMSVSDFERDVVRPYKQITNWSDNLALPKATMQKLPMALEAEVEAAAGRGGGLAKYAAGKKDYGKLAELSDIASEGLKRQSAQKGVSLYDAMAGMTALQHGLSHGAGLSSVAMGGAGVLGSKLIGRFGNQVSATGADALARFLQSPGTASGQKAALLAALLSQQPTHEAAPQPPEGEKAAEYARLLGGTNL